MFVVYHMIKSLVLCLVFGRFLVKSLGHSAEYPDRLLVVSLISFRNVVE